MPALPLLERRPATDADIPFLLALRRETMQAHLVAGGLDCSDAQHLERLMQHFDCAEVVCSPDEPVGLLKIRRAPPDWEILQFQLSPRLQGQGAGRLLLEQVIIEASGAGAGLKLGVLKANPAQRLYERLGFKIVGEDAHEYCMALRPGGRD